jgi:hypothetical protein
MDFYSSMLSVIDSKFGLAYFRDNRWCAVNRESHWGIMHDRPVVIWSSKRGHFAVIILEKVLFKPRFDFVPNDGYEIVTVGPTLFVIKTQSVEHLVSNSTVPVNAAWLVIQNLRKIKNN